MISFSHPAARRGRTTLRPVRSEADLDGRSATMKAPAVVFVEPRKMEIREMTLPDVGPSQIGIKTAYSGVSQGTERWALTGRGCRRR
jgi:hypothetical protein